MESGAWLLLAVALLLRFSVGLHSYSGAATPPKYGDYEAQRHWMEVAIHTPIHTWYTDTEHNNYSYWPLDYPPLSAYQSWLHGKVIAWFDPEALALGTSRGYETYYSKLLMRWSVVASDVLVFFPAALLCAAVFSRTRASAVSSPSATCQRALLILAAALLQPASVLVDHGHFQYNCISLGFAAAAAGCIAGGFGGGILGSVLFCLSLNHKQMGLFYAPAFFAHLLGRSLLQKGWLSKVLAVGKLGATVVATFAVCWLPYLASVEEVLKVLQRVLPMQRGLYEDYVANFWCASSVAVKWREAVPQQAMVRICTAATLLATAPSMAHQMARPSRSGLLHCMANSGLAFFMFAYHVHEKSILLPLLPITLLAAEYPTLAAFLPPLAAFSMFPLLVRDGLALAYFGAIGMYVAAMLYLQGEAAEGGGPPQQTEPTEDVAGKPLPAEGRPLPGARWQGTGKLRVGGGGHKARRRGRGVAELWAAVERWIERYKRVAMWGVGLMVLGLHAGKVWVPPPERYTWLYDRAFITLSFVVLVAVMVYLNVQQWKLPREVEGYGLEVGTRGARVAGESKKDS